MNDMEKKNFGYSLKNIPIPSKQTYFKSLLDKTHSFLKRMRWKAHFFDHPSPSTQKPENFGFNSEKSPPPIKDLAAFENDMYSLIRSIDFKDHHSSGFQKKLNDDIREISNSPCVFVPADKTTNVYKLSPSYYNKLLSDNITATYKKSPCNAKSNIDKEAKLIAAKLQIADRAECFAKRESFITLKDHKDNFPNNPKCRLINPAKSEIGIVSKKFLEKIISDVQRTCKCNQWRSTATVIDWFDGIPQKETCRFVQLDIVEFYPSISADLLEKSLDFARSITAIDADTYRIIMHARKSLLFDKENIWVKKNNPHFDVTMGSYDGAEICEIVGLYLLNVVKDKCKDIELGLYRDDGLGITRNLSGPQTERLKKLIVKTFKSCGLRITIECNIQQANFLDVTFNLSNGKYWPYRKPNDIPLYIHRESNHPPNHYQRAASDHREENVINFMRRERVPKGH